MLPVLGEKDFARHKIQAAADHIARGKCWAVLHAFTRRGKEVAVITVIPIRGLVPAGKTIQRDRLLAQTNAHKPS